MSLNFCDLLVLGSDLSGVMTATLLAKRGLNVLILDDEEEDEPGPNLATGIGSRAFRSLLGKLMIPDSRLAILHENKVSCQVVFPRHRVDLYTSRPLFLKEIEREFPGEKEVLEELLQEIDALRENYLDEILSFLPLIGTREKKRFLKWYQGFPGEKTLSLWGRLSPELQALLKCKIKFLSRGDLIEPLVLQLLLFLPPEEGQTFTIRGGIRELKKLFFNRLDYFGGMVHPLGREPFQVMTKGREVRAVQLSRYNFPTRCRFLLGNTDVRKLYQELPSPFFPFLFGRTKKKILSLQPREERHIFQYYARREVFPLPMKENLVVGDPLSPLEGINYLEVNWTPLAKGTPDGFDTLLTVSLTLSPGTNSDASLQEEVDKKIRHLIPFAEDHLKKIFPQKNEPAEEPELFPESDRPPEEISPQVHRVAYPPSLFFPPIDSPLKNLFVVGPNILDWLGLEGKMLAALRAVDLIWSRELKVRNP